MFDRTTNGSCLKWLSIMDEFTRECLALKVDRSITSEDVIDTLAELFALRGVPKCIRIDNGPKFIATAIQHWLKRVEVETLYIEPGAPWENRYAESFYSRFRDEFLAVEEFETLSAARRLTGFWKEDYNHLRPHSSLGYVAPAVFAARSAASTPEKPSPTAQPSLPFQLHNETYSTQPSYPLVQLFQAPQGAWEFITGASNEPTTGCINSSAYAPTFTKHA